MSEIFNEVQLWSFNNNMNINVSKTKEMLIGKANCIPDLWSAYDCSFLERITAF